MTTLEIEQYANEEGLSVGAKDVNLAVRLRKKVIPKFEADVGNAAWRRKVGTIPMVIGTEYYDLPADFSDMLDWPLYIITGGGEIPLFYIGENAPLIAISQNQPANGTPNGYWIDRITAVAPAATELRRLHLNSKPNAAAALHYVYMWTLRFTSMTEIVELDNYMPTWLQWALVEALKAELFMVRGGIDDPRVALARQEYQRYVNDGIEYKEPGRKEVLKRVRQGPS